MFRKLETRDIEALSAITGRDYVSVRDEIHPDYTHDEMTHYGCFDPELVIQPGCTEEVSQILAYANQEHLPVTTRGAGTGLCGGCVPIHGGIVMSTMRMNKILEIDEQTMNAVLQPGVLLMEIIEEAANHNLLYAPDPGEKSASVGGNVMTNAGGMRAVKYGVTRDYVRGLEVVLADGSVLTLGGKTSKNSSGYSLKDLIVGSEGTLAVVTKITMKLLPKPRAMTSLLIPFTTLKDALTLVPKIMRLPAVATTIEFMEKEVIQDAQDYLGKDFPNKEFNAYLIVSYSANTPEEMQAMIHDCAELVLQEGAEDVFISDTEERQSSIWDARGAFLEAIKNSTTQMDECDVVVDIDKVADFCQFARDLSIQEDIRIRSFGHAGDGNLHIYVLKDALPEDEWQRKVARCMDALYAKAAAMKGQVSGEHGIGHAKRDYLKQSLDPVQIELMKRIKAAFDPNGILNPGKVIG
ncbi:FAD-binding oxidoreductase [Holdemania filiformis]|uniref:FAD-binding oxidoreductase n=1 Tax=Holdemania filiformis TaxID=61171 RepID=UPI00266F0AC7|nr:FAD-linked oxidase C-terminal domain-containing protein [Holdemania filiformis]